MSSTLLATATQHQQPASLTSLLQEAHAADLSLSLLFSSMQLKKKKVPALRRNKKRAKYALPSQAKAYNGKPTVVLDMDETLVHSMFTRNVR